jgi:hypothetical protein
MKVSILQLRRTMSWQRKNARRRRRKWIFGNEVVRLIVFGSMIMVCGAEKTIDCP